jgi:hypothetical protein
MAQMNSTGGGETYGALARREYLELFGTGIDRKWHQVTPSTAHKKESHHVCAREAAQRCDHESRSADSQDEGCAQEDADHAP